jgi:sugar diacid utilization regulator
MLSKDLLDDVFSELAQRIVDGIKEAAAADANFIGSDGIIIASSNQVRIGSIHEGGRRIMNGECNEIAITETAAAQMAGTKPGYNGVLLYDGQRIAVIGISGNPETVKPIQKIAAIAAIDEIRRFVERRNEQTVVTAMKNDIRDIAAQMQVISINGSIQAAKFGEKGNVFKIVVNEMQRLTEKINKIIEQN